MAQIDVAVIGAGVSSLAAAAPSRSADTRRAYSNGIRVWPRHELAQQRCHPRRALLSRRHAEGATLRRRRASDVRVLRRPRRAHARCGKLAVAHGGTDQATLEELRLRATDTS